MPPQSRRKRPLALDTQLMEDAGLIPQNQDDGILYDDVPDHDPRELPPDEEMSHIFRDEEGRAKYTIEVRFGKYRSRTHAVARIDCWINDFIPIGKQNPNDSVGEVRSVGADHMFFCGYPDCGKPFASKYVGSTIEPYLIQQAEPADRWRLVQSHFAVCPHCNDAKKNNNGRQIASAEFSGYRLSQDTNRLVTASNNTFIKDKVTGISYPTIRDCIMISATPPHIAEIMARLWHDLEGDADVYLKYNPHSIRDQMNKGVFNYVKPTWDEEEELAIYPIANIVKDTTAGASLAGRFKAFIMS